MWRHSRHTQIHPQIKQRQKESDEWVLSLKESHQSDTIQEDTVPRNGDSWYLSHYQWERQNKDLKPEYSWQSIDAWQSSTDDLRSRGAIAKQPWEVVSFLHPKIKPAERHVVEQDGLFLENAVQLHEDYCLVYLSTHELPNNWYRFGGEGHLVEVESHSLSEQHIINRLLRRKIQRACALVTVGVWGTKQYSHRYPLQADFPRNNLKMLTDRPVPYRYRVGRNRKEATSVLSDDYDSARKGRLSRGRYAVPAGSVYVFNHPLNLSWWDFPNDWFPKEGFPLKHLGCGLCLPIDIQGIPQETSQEIPQEIQGVL